MSRPVRPALPVRWRCRPRTGAQGAGVGRRNSSPYDHGVSAAESPADDIRSTGRHHVVVDFSRCPQQRARRRVLGDFGPMSSRSSVPSLGDDLARGHRMTPRRQPVSTRSTRNKRPSPRSGFLYGPTMRAIGPDRRHRGGRTSGPARWASRPGLRGSATREPRLICSITGFGRDAGHRFLGYADLLVQAVSGLMSVTGPGPARHQGKGRTRRRPDQLHAYRECRPHHRDRGEGQRVETNLLAALLSRWSTRPPGISALQVVPGIMGNRHQHHPIRDVPDRGPADRPGRRQRQAVRGYGRSAPEYPRSAPIPASVQSRSCGQPAEPVRRPRRGVRAHGADHWHAVLTEPVPAGPINDLGGVLCRATRPGAGSRGTGSRTRRLRIRSPLSASPGWLPTAATATGRRGTAVTRSRWFV